LNYWEVCSNEATFYFSKHNNAELQLISSFKFIIIYFYMFTVYINTHEIIYYKFAYVTD